MSKLSTKIHEAFAANGKALICLFVTFIPVGMGAGYLGFWLFHTWAYGFVVSGVYILALMFVWGRMLLYIRNPD